MESWRGRGAEMWRGDGLVRPEFRRCIGCVGGARRAWACGRSCAPSSQVSGRGRYDSLAGGGAKQNVTACPVCTVHSFRARLWSRSIMARVLRCVRDSQPLPASARAALSRLFLLFLLSVPSFLLVPLVTAFSSCVVLPPPPSGD